MNSDDVWENVEDAIDEPPSSFSLRVSHFWFIKEKCNIPVSKLPLYARNAVQKAVAQLDPFTPTELQLYCSPEKVWLRKASEPYLISSLDGEFSFSISVQQGQKIKVARRCLTRKIKK